MQWEVQARNDSGWTRKVAFAKRRDARLFLEDNIPAHEATNT